MNRPPNSGGSGGSQQSKDAATPVKVPSSLLTPYSHVIQPESTAGPVVEGDFSLVTHSAFANEFPQKVIRPGSPQDPSLEMRETLDALSNIATALKQQTAASEMAFPHTRPIQRPRLSGFVLPPIQKAVALILTAKSQRMLGGTAWIYEFLPTQRFPDLCLNVYFSENHSEADFIAVNAGLHSLFWDYAAHGPPELEEENLAYMRMCGVNLETALSNLPLHLPASSDMIAALLFGAVHAIEVSKPSLSWTLSSKASELCQTLGYHRVASMKNDTESEGDYKKFLFWSVYFVDKSLSLRLGRPSTMPDWDIAVPEPSTEDAGHSRIWTSFILRIGTARCQGNIYELLYSPDSISQPDHVRQARVQTLVTELHGLEKMAQETHIKWHSSSKEAISDDLMSFFIVSNDVLRLSLLTLAYRAAPRPTGSITTFSFDCIKAARATLERHQDCVVIMRKSAEAYLPTYDHWTLLYAPFISFIVIFCQVIETQNKTDLAHLHTFVTSIQSALTVSDAASRMHRLFQVLHSVALRYVEFRICTPHGCQTQASAEMNTYLAALGFLVAGLSEGQRAAANPMMTMGNETQLEDWFYSNQAIMELLEEPTLDFPNRN
ncbi:fungal-specific transcription factor domain-containing protein [Dactylonectria macrodidyma]|uniref:Fungal-specific transcription factor domain-containing protein n=1 Tax=Dactylonectria macrodidyma TaxID=307937 RepID=A0A9P9EQN1_9HYPO|nr:fungal-specific transcription factor domain-containing protein [Dactylonectria macrodidyma]